MSDLWCIGYRRNPHVPDGGASVLTNISTTREVRLCRDCHRAWAAEDHVEADW